MFASTGYSQTVSPKWLVIAEEYLAANRLIWGIPTTAKGADFSEALAERDEIKRRFDQSEPPSYVTLEKKINSDVLEDQLIGCVGVMLSGRFSENILRQLLNNMFKKEASELKLYSLFALKHAEYKELEPFENDIFQALKQETDEWIIYNEIPWLTKFPKEKQKEILTYLFLKTESDATRIFAYAFLRKLGPAYKEEFLNRLKEDGNVEVLEFIEEIETRKEVTQPEVNSIE